MRKKIKISKIVDQLFGDLSNDFINEIDNRIEEVQAKVINEKDLDEIGDIEHREETLFFARSIAAKEIQKSLLSTLTHIEKKFHNELQRGKELFPHNWMFEDIRISENMKRYKKMNDVLNFFFQSNRYIRGKEFDKMEDIAMRMVSLNKLKSGKDSVPSIIIVNDAFYKKMENKLKCGRRLIQAYMKGFCAVSIFKYLGKDGNRNGLYHDGRFVQMPYGRKRKIPTLKNAPEYKQALINFKPIGI